VGGRGMDFEGELPLLVYTAEQYVSPEVATYHAVSRADKQMNRIGL